jgi:hypothetical protein
MNRTLVANTTRGLSAMTARAESYDAGPDAG